MFAELTPEQIDALVGTRHATTDIEFPPQGLQPYHQWLIRTLHRLAECSLGAFRVDQALEGTTSVRVAPGRASINDEVVVFKGQTLDLVSFNNATAKLWLEEASGDAVAQAGEDWPASPHLRLAEVEVSEGVVVAITDLRLEAVFRV